MQKSCLEFWDSNLGTLDSRGKLSSFIKRTGILGASSFNLIFLWLLQLHPDKVCQKIGVCPYNQTLGVRLEFSDSFPSFRLLSDQERWSKTFNLYLFSHEESQKQTSGLCNFCEMVVFWIQVEIRKDRSKELALRYADQVRFFSMWQFWYFRVLVS